MPPAATRRPQLKHTSPTFGSGETIFIGGYGEVTEIADPTGAIRRLLALLDGTRTTDEVHKELSADFPEVTRQDVDEALAQFDEARFLLDDQQTADGVLEAHELKRWERNINFFGSFARMDDNKYDLQRRLRDCRVTLLGLGGLGSHILLDMAAMGVGHVRAVEFDRVELSNLNRQILYREEDIGKEKLHLAVERVKQFNPHIDIEPVDLRISSVEDVARVLEGSDVCISVADRPKMEIANWVNEACVRAGVPLITGGLETQRAVYYTMLPGTTGCIECWRRQTFASDEVSGQLLQEKRDRQIGGDNAAFCPLVTMTTGFLIGELTRIVTAIAPPVAAGRLMELRFADYAMGESERWERQSDCPVCGPTAGPTAADASPADLAARA
ncbi:ThiF family adenylyltransferase [Streptomyces sp. ISL-66]|uniref:HesA/MoeB/ThiF family protein n=1 Tax=Streptomyces sp. ISL-66 TaxID=2819186 RepID=UPI001BE9B091|nr:ThiF family adenylyltransferase [Streptomyces sp. ISL-66]MBT2468529.1 ThiF family adenylyltransferase [Streptomyces sp. ISL-66]